MPKWRSIAGGGAIQPYEKVGYVYVTQQSTSWLKCTQTTLDIHMLKNILLTKMETHDIYH